MARGGGGEKLSRVWPIALGFFVVGLFVTALSIKGIVYFAKRREQEPVWSAVAIMVIAVFALMGFAMSGCAAMVLLSGG